MVLDYKFLRRIRNMPLMRNNMSQSYSNTVAIIGFYIPQRPEKYDERKRIQLLLKEDCFRSSYSAWR